MLFFSRYHFFALFFLRAITFCALFKSRFCFFCALFSSCFCFLCAIFSAFVFSCSFFFKLSLFSRFCFFGALFLCAFAFSCYCFFCVLFSLLFRFFCALFSSRFCAHFCFALASTNRKKSTRRHFWVLLSLIATESVQESTEKLQPHVVMTTSIHTRPSAARKLFPSRSLFLWTTKALPSPLYISSLYVPVDRSDGVPAFPAALHQHHTRVSYLPQG